MARSCRPGAPSRRVEVGQRGTRRRAPRPASARASQAAQHADGVRLRPGVAPRRAAGDPARRPRSAERHDRDHRDQAAAPPPRRDTSARTHGAQPAPIRPARGRPVIHRYRGRVTLPTVRDRRPRRRRRRLPRGLGAPAPGARRGRGRRAPRHRAAARAPADLHRRQAHRAARAARRPGGAPVIDVDRGGKITFHGPGQLVGYPIVRLPDHVQVVDYVRRVEEALIGVCADFGVTTARVPGRSGVWLRGRRRAAPSARSPPSASGSAAA